MKHRWCALALVALMPLAAACSRVEATESAYEDPATLTPAPEGESELMQVTFTRKAIERIGIETAPVVSSLEGLVVPYGAILYDPDGSTWVFTEVKERTFHRVPVTVADIRGSEAILTAGPLAGTPVVRVGASELFGAEHELGAH